jgi:hypothetical protein
MRYLVAPSVQPIKAMGVLSRIPEMKERRFSI